MNPVTLAFRDPDVERAYLASRAARYVSRQTAVGYVFAATMWLVMAGWATIALRGAPARGVVSAVWLMNVPVLLGGAAAVRFIPRERLVRWVPALSSGLAYVGLAFVVAQALLGPTFAPYAAPMLAMYILCVHAFMGLRFVEASIASGMLAIAHLVVVALIAPLRASLPTSVFFLGIGQIFGMIVSRRDERYRRRDFHQVTLLARERARSDRLLANMLPAAIAERLKDTEDLIADVHGDVSVLFADIVGFTALSEKLSPAELVDLLNRVFTAFDELADRMGLEKIKTIGDAYMIVGGLPKPRADQAAVVVDMAFAMRDALASIRPDLRLALRIGIHAGPVVAGVIGKRKYSYDLWGDTVNTASRMESHGAPNRIHVSEPVRAALGERYVLEPRGTVEIKGKGPMTTYWIVGPAARSIS